MSLVIPRLILVALVAIPSLATIGLRAEAAVAPVRLTFSVMAGTPLDSDVTTWPSQIRALADQEVRLTGYLLPLTTVAGRTSEFLLMRSQNGCCFGKLPMPNEFVVVHAPAPGLPVLMDTPVSVRGLLRLKPVGPPGGITQLFMLDEAAAQ